MTCIVGLAEGGVVYIGGDSAGVTGYDIASRADEKVFTNGDLLMGFTSSFRMGQLLRYSFTAPEQSSRKDDMTYLVTDFIDAVREMYHEKGFMRKENEAEEGGTFLLGFHGKLYTIEDDFQVGRPGDGYAAVGSGSQIALGAMFATRNSKLSPANRIEIALLAASEYNAGVRGPFLVMQAPEVESK